MKNVLIVLLLVVGSSLTALGQKYAYVDSQYILENLASYREAQKELDRISAQWQKEIEDRYASIERLYQSYQAEKVLLTEEMRAKREEEIVRKEKEARDLQRQRFGVEGDLFKRRQELIQPIQNEIYQAIKETAESGGFMVIFDKSGQSNILYSDPRYDRSDRVLRKLGVKTGGAGGDSDDDDAASPGGGAKSGGLNDGGTMDRGAQQRK